jgi:hypothetical protein
MKRKEERNHVDIMSIIDNVTQLIIAKVLKGEMQQK